MTNRQWLAGLLDEEAAEVLSPVGCPPEIKICDIRGKGCIECWLNWLRAEDVVPTTADVVEVVRCKDCAYWGTTLSEDDFKKAKNDPYSDCVCDMWESDGFGPNDFCSRARRRTDNG